jgi:hypothetical protein
MVSLTEQLCSQRFRQFSLPYATWAYEKKDTQRAVAGLKAHIAHLHRCRHYVDGCLLRRARVFMCVQC